MISVFSDIHANHLHLKEALPLMRQSDSTIFLGDAVGYRKDPQKTIALLRDNVDFALQGNHDAAAVGQFDEFLGILPPWLQETLLEVSSLPEEDFAWLATRKRVLQIDNCTLIHASPRDPLMEFLTPESADDNFSLFDTPILLVGHTHKALAIGCRKEGNIIFDPFQEKGALDLSLAEKWILNPGSLGSSKNPSWMVVDDTKVSWIAL